MENDFLMIDDLRTERGNGRDALMVLMDRLVREEGLMRAADKLGVNYKTLATAQQTRRLSRRMTQVLELRLLSEDNPVFQLHEERLSAFGKRFDKLEYIVKEVVAGVEQLRATVEAHRAEQDRINRALDRGVSSDSAARKAVTPGEVRKQPARQGKGVLAITSIEAPGKPTRPTFPRRNYDEVVTAEPANDDSYVYGKAWPVVREWRMLRRDHPQQGKTLTWMEKHERLLKVELALLSEYKLILPPDNKPIDDWWRAHVTKWRLDDLRDVRRRILRRKLLRCFRRFATCGAWWG